MACGMHFPRLTAGAPSRTGCEVFLKKLSEAFGVSGHEEEVRALILEEIRDTVDECRVDAMGNLIARKKARGSSSIRVLGAAHMTSPA